MLIRDILATHRAKGSPVFSCEFFPPKTDEGHETLFETINVLSAYAPDFFSVTYGAGGSTQSVSLSVTERIVRESGITTLAHLTCVGASADELARIIDAYAEVGVNNILALRGDPVSGPGTAWVTAPGGFTYAIELVEMLRNRGDFSIGVAAFPEGHPESASLDDDARVLAEKQKAGADYAITNLFFRADAYFGMIERAAAYGCDMPVLPGLMPVTNVNQIERITALSGAEFPTHLREAFDRVRDDAESVIQLGIEVTTQLAQELLAGGAPGIHLYPLNRSRSAAAILDNLGVTHS